MIPANPRVEAHYETLEQSWPTVDGSLFFERLVVPTGNADSSYHRWFHLKEAFSVDMLETVLKRLGHDDLKRLRILDCFAGGGTTLVSALKTSSQFPNGVDAVGIERNPFLHLVAQAKLGGLTAGKPLAEKVVEAAACIQRAYFESEHLQFPVPALSTLSNQRYFPGRQLHNLLRLKASILSAVPSGILRDILLTAAASTVEVSGKLRRDGRALRFSGNRKPKDPWIEFRSRVDKIVEDISGTNSVSGFAQVVKGDGRRPSIYTDGGERDLIIFSPPYPNNIDYTEIYKMEAWYLDCYADSESFRSQRLSTLRSHPSVRFEDTYHYATSSLAPAVDSLIAPVVEAIPDDRYRSGRLQLVRGYVDDMLTLFQECRKLISEEGRLVFVVGNSAHGDNDSRFIIAADLLMARLGELSGWKVEEIAVARKLRRRETISKFLRESVVTLAPA